MRRIEGGIYIDWNCSEVVRLPEGVFIPLLTTSDQAEELERELRALEDKFFGKDLAGGVTHPSISPR